RKARHLVYHVSKNAFGENNVVSHLAQTNLRSLLKKVPLDLSRAPKKVMEIVRDFEKSNQKYIV
ncbi:MAG: hypothetical protein ACFFAO_10520, partial [Candidatus Hermodarchaeota archaeon]